jgi:pimeloyl-ACP methyl ester carboxylesterase
MRTLILVIAATGIPARMMAQSSPAPADSFTAPLAVAVANHGDTLRGFIRVAQGAGPHLTVLFLQGFPGAETPKFPATMQAAGFNGVGFNFRGNRNSGGLFTLEGAIEDAKTMVAFLRADSARRTYRVDRDRIVLVAASAGTLSALRTTADDPRIGCVAAMVPFNWALAATTARTDTMVRRRFETVMQNVTSGPEPAIRERGFLERVLANAESYDLVPVGSMLKDRGVMLVGAQQDATAPLPLHFTPLVATVRTAGARLRDTIVSDSHNLPTTGDAVGEAIVRWLRSDCRGA